MFVSACCLVTEVNTGAPYLTVPMLNNFKLHYKMRFSFHACFVALLVALLACELMCLQYNQLLLELKDSETKRKTLQQETMELHRTLEQQEAR